MMTFKPRINFRLYYNFPRTFSTSSFRPALELKFDHYEGSETSRKRDQRTDRQILILHGLFGSKAKLPFDK